MSPFEGDCHPFETEHHVTLLEDQVVHSDFHRLDLPPPSNLVSKHALFQVDAVTPAHDSHGQRQRFFRPTRFGGSRAGPCGTIPREG